MALYLAVVSGPGAGTRHPLKKDLIRLGSAAGCEICVVAENLPPHALSLEISGDQCRVHNRTEKTVTCAGNTLAPRASAPWPVDADLEIVPGLILRVEHGEAAIRAPSRPAWDEETQPTTTGPNAEIRPAQTPAPPPAKSSQSMAQLVITTACLAASALLLWNKFAAKDGAAAGKRATVTLNQVLDKLDSSPDEPPWPQIRQSIQEAYRLDRSGDAAGAKKRYARVVQIIFSRQAAPVALSVPESGDLPTDQHRQLQNLASQLPDELDRTVFLYAMNRL